MSAVTRKCQNAIIDKWSPRLIATLILSGYEVTCPKPGPDVGIVYRGRRIWFECVSPTAGNPGSLDYIPEPKMGEVSDVPNEKMVLRYLNSISEKYERQYANWLAKGHVSKDDAFVIALNPRNIPFEHADTEPPRILQAAYTVGPLYVVINRETGKAESTGYHFRDHIEKNAQGRNGGVRREERAGQSNDRRISGQKTRRYKWPVVLARGRGEPFW
jgi:hypothetical protein